MPIFQEPDSDGSYLPWPMESRVNYGPPPHLITDVDVIGTNAWDIELSDTSPVDSEMGNYSPSKVQTSDRGELIQCIKRGETPTWVPNHSVRLISAPPSNDLF
jgi:hypothetical protein